MVNTINTLIEKNKQLLTKIEELENNKNTEINREAQLKIIKRIEDWKKENYETGDRLKKYQGNTYPSHIVDNVTEDRPLWKQLASHVNFELLMAQYLHTKENPLDELIEMMLDSITRNVVGYYNLKGLEEKEVEEHREEVNNLRKKFEEKEKLVENKVKELTVFKEQIESLKENMAETLLTYFEEEKQEEKGNWDYWHKEEVKELINNNKDKPVEVVIKVVGKWEADAKDHAEALDVAEEWKDRQVKGLKQEIKESSKLLKKTLKKSEDQEVRIEKLERELREQKELLRKSEKSVEGEIIQSEKLEQELSEEKNKNKELEKEVFLLNKFFVKDLPSLPKKEKKFKALRTKTKAKVQHLVEKTKKWSQELIARIEVKS